MRSDSGACWLCGGAGRLTTGGGERWIACGACAGTGVVSEAPETVEEMAAAIAAMVGIERHTLSAAEIDAAVAEYGPAVEQALRGIEAEAADEVHWSVPSQ